MKMCTVESYTYLTEGNMVTDRRVTFHGLPMFWKEIFNRPDQLKIPEDINLPTKPNPSLASSRADWHLTGLTQSCGATVSRRMSREDNVQKGELMAKRYEGDWKRSWQKNENELLCFLLNLFAVPVTQVRLCSSFSPWTSKLFSIVHLYNISSFI